jgi:hypothetical protein
MTSSGAGDIILLCRSAQPEILHGQKAMGGTGIDQVAGLTRDILWKCLYNRIIQWHMQISIRVQPRFIMLQVMAQPMFL